LSSPVQWEEKAAAAPIHVFDTFRRRRPRRCSRRCFRFCPVLGNRFSLPDREHRRLPHDCVDPFPRYECENFLKKCPSPNRNYLSEGFRHDRPSNTDSLHESEAAGGKPANYKGPCL
jgi:hypothetical protein